MRTYPNSQTKLANLAQSIIGFLIVSSLATSCCSVRSMRSMVLVSLTMVVSIFFKGVQPAKMPRMRMRVDANTTTSLRNWRRPFSIECVSLCLCVCALLHAYMGIGESYMKLWLWRGMLMGSYETRCSLRADKSGVLMCIVWWTLSASCTAV